MIELYVVQLSNGELHRGTTAIPVYKSEAKARSTVEQNWPGIVSQGYKIIKLIEEK